LGFWGYIDNLPFFSSHTKFHILVGIFVVAILFSWSNGWFLKNHVILWGVAADVLFELSLKQQD
jgi:hypothetical protein